MDVLLLHRLFGVVGRLGRSEGVRIIRWVPEEGIARGWLSLVYSSFPGYMYC